MSFAAGATTRLDRFLRKRLGVPDPIAHGFLRGLRVAIDPREHRLRRHVAKQIEHSLSASDVIPRSDGFRLFGPGGLPGLDEAVARCRVIFEQQLRGRDPASFVRKASKQFLRPLAHGADFCGQPELLRFVLSRPILDAATCYLGSVPLLAGAALWWTPANETAVSSQLFHVDDEDSTQLKLFVNVLDTGEDRGPLTFFPADLSEQIRRAVRQRGRRLDDERVLAAAGGSQPRRLVGPRGTGAFLDTSRCLHYGSRGNRRERVLLMFQFLSRFAPGQSTARLQVPRGLPGLVPDLVQRLALGWY